MKNSKTYSIKEAKEKNLNKIAEIQNLQYANSEERDLASDFNIEGEKDLERSCHDKIEKQNKRIKELLSELTDNQIELLLTSNVTYVDGEGGSDKIVVE